MRKMIHTYLYICYKKTSAKLTFVFDLFEMAGHKINRNLDDSHLEKTILLI